MFPGKSSTFKKIENGAGPPKYFQQRGNRDLIIRMENPKIRER
jgi:hypothetical protein